MNKHSLWMALGRHRAGLAMLDAYLRLRGKDSRVVGADTALVAEGYPRSANTYAVACMRVLHGPDIRLAHHVHGPAQVTEGIRRGVPVLVLIREPLAAVASLAQRDPRLQAGQALLDYARFYAPLVGQVEHFVLADFETVVSDFGAVLAMVNTRFKTRFETTLTDAARRQVADLIDAMDRADRGADEHHADTVARPHEQRKKRSAATAERLQRELGAELARAQHVYRAMLDAAAA